MTQEYRNRINEIADGIKHEPEMRKMRDDISEGIKSTGNRQADVEEQFQEVIENTTDKDVVSAPEIIAARDGEPNLRERLQRDHQEVTAQLAQTAYLVHPSGGDDSENIADALTNYKRVVMADGEYHANIKVYISNTHIEGGDVTLLPLDDSVVPLEIIGDNNTLSGFNVESNGRRSIKLTGDNNIIKGNKLKGIERIASGSNVNYIPVIEIEGSFNHVVFNEIYNGGLGVLVHSGEHNVIEMNRIHDNSIGIRNMPSAKYTKIFKNYIHDNNISSDSGADGILIHRNSTGTWVKFNHITHSGEHGIYAQGDNMIISGNIVSHSHSSGIKLGSHETDLHDHVGEYHLHSISIFENSCYENGDAGIYIQTPWENITISRNKCYDNVSSGIRTVYIPSERFFADCLIVENNIVDSMYITGHLNTVVRDNDAEESIFVYAKSTASGERNRKPIVSGNKTKSLILSRVSAPIIEGNVVQGEFGVQSDTPYKLFNNDLTLNNDYIITNLSLMENNRIIFLNGKRFTGFYTLTSISENEIESLDLISDQLLFAMESVTNNLSTRIKDNHFKIGTNGRFFFQRNANTIMGGNIFEGGMDGVNISISGGFVLFTENIGIGNATVHLYGGARGIIKNNKIKTTVVPSENVIVADNFAS